MANRRKEIAQQIDGAAEITQQVSAQSGSERIEGLQAIRDTLLSGLQLLHEVAKRYNDETSIKGISPIREVLDKLDERGQRGRLPEHYIRMILNDARLDAFIVYSNMKVAALYYHQELIAPTEKLKKEIQEQRQLIREQWDDVSLTNPGNPDQALALIREDLNTLVRAEKLIREGGDSSHILNSNDGEMKPPSQ